MTGAIESYTHVFGCQVTDSAACDACRDAIVRDLGGWRHLTVYCEGVEMFFAPPP